MAEDGLPVVLLHGCGGSAGGTFIETGWVDKLRAAGRIVLPITLPGHGAAASHDPAAYGDLAGETLAVLPARFDAVGFSLGGKLLLEIAARAPGRIGRIVVGGVGDNVFAPEKVGPAIVAVLENGIGTDTPAPFADFYRGCEAGGVDPLAVAAVLRRPPNPVLPAERLARVAAPVLLVVGDADPGAMPAAGLIAALPNVRAEILPGVDHFSLPANDDFRQLALAFLQAA